MQLRPPLELFSGFGTLGGGSFSSTLGDGSGLEVNLILTNLFALVASWEALEGLYGSLYHVNMHMVM